MMPLIQVTKHQNEFTMSAWRGLYWYDTTITSCRDYQTPGIFKYYTADKMVVVLFFVALCFCIASPCNGSLYNINAVVLLFHS